MTKHHLKQIRRKVWRQRTLSVGLRQALHKFFVNSPSWFCNEIPGLVPMDTPSGTAYAMNIIKTDEHRKHS